MNISFVKLGHEECEICEEMSLHNPEHKKDALKDDCDMCLKWKSHIEQAEAARQEYGTDRDAAIDDDSIIFSADLEKVIMLPRMDTFKTALFTRRIIALTTVFCATWSVKEVQTTCSDLARSHCRKKERGHNERILCLLDEIS